MPQGNNRSQVGGATLTMFGMDVLDYPQIDTIVLDFLISLALWNDVAESVDFGSANLRKLGFFAPQIFRGHV